MHNSDRFVRLCVRPAILIFFKVLKFLNKLCVYGSNGLWSGATFISDGIFSCPGSSIPDLAQWWLTATLGFQHKEWLSRLETLQTFDQSVVKTKRQNEKKTKRQKDKQTKRQNDKKTKIQKGKKKKRKKEKKTQKTQKTQKTKKTKRQKTKTEKRV